MASRIRTGHLSPFLCALLLLYCIAGGKGASARIGENNGSTSDDPGDAQRATVICGPNAIYAMLLGNGIHCTPDTVDQLIPKNAAGMSLQEVSNALSSRGLRVAVRQITPSELGRCPLPCIIYSRRPTVTGGHYYVVMSVDGDVVQLMDPTTAEVYPGRVSNLRNVWEGYAIVPVEGPGFIWLASLGALATMLALVAILRFRQRHPRFQMKGGKPIFVSRSSRAFAHVVATRALVPSVVIMTVAIATAGLRAATPDGYPVLAASAGLWRTDRNSGINCLYIEGRREGREIRYSDVVAVAAGVPDANTIAGLATVAKRCGIAMVPVRMTFRELSEQSAPSIVFMEPAGIGSGTFALPIGVGEREVDYIDGGSVRWIHMTPDRFRRSWTGYALTRAYRRPLWLIAVSYLCVPVGLYIGITWVKVDMRRRATWSQR